MVELRERNGKKHIVSDDEKTAFAWAGYYSQCSNIFINGRDYRVVHVTDSSIEFSDGSSLPIGCYAIFKSENETIIYDDYKLREARSVVPLSSHLYCFDDETFFKVA